MWVEQPSRGPVAGPEQMGPPFGVGRREESSGKAVTQARVTGVDGVEGSQEPGWREFWVEGEE